MKTFKNFILESSSSESHAVLAFGRMNPPTAGHERVIDKVHQVADKHNAIHQVVLSHSHDLKKNPLSPEDKVKYAKHAFPNTNIKASSKEKPTILHHASDLSAKGVTHLHVIAGSDRVGEMSTLLHKYNGAEGGKHGSFKFHKITVHSAGERDPDSDDTSGVSGTKMREFASSGDRSSFHSNLPSKMSPKHKEGLYNTLRKSMGHDD
jgi:hypothetical protein